MEFIAAFIILYCIIFSPSTDFAATRRCLLGAVPMRLAVTWRDHYVLGIKCYFVPSFSILGLVSVNVIISNCSQQ